MKKKNTFWISSAPRTGSMWLFNITREILKESGYEVYPKIIPQYDKKMLDIYYKEALPDQNDLNKYVFKVCVTANKLQIKNEIEKRFKVEILKVSTMNFNGKRKNTTIRSGGHVLRTSGKRSSWKKAIVTLKEGQKIDLVEGNFN